LRGCSPLPIPNREVKPLSADGTAVKRGRVSRRQSFHQNPKAPPKGAFFIGRLGDLACGDEYVCYGNNLLRCASAARLTTGFHPTSPIPEEYSAENAVLAPTPGARLPARQQNAVSRRKHQPAFGTANQDALTAVRKTAQKHRENRVDQGFCRMENRITNTLPAISGRASDFQSGWMNAPSG
jgi:hypothetical protein